MDKEVSAIALRFPEQWFTWRRKPRRRSYIAGLTVALTVGALGAAVLSLSSPGKPANPITAPQTPAAPPSGTPSQPPIEPPAVTPPVAPTETVPAPKPLKPPVIRASCAILIDAVSGQVLYEHNADKPRPMASTTKVMTALLFRENVKDDAIITASENASETTGSSLHLKKGEKVGANDLLHAILMRSANDACVAAAEHISGTEAAFAEKMNARAKELGATHTHFVNSHGLHDPMHYTTARDLALITRAALQDPRICRIVCTQHYRIRRSMDNKDVSLRNHSHFLGKFAGADGVKTGWTVPAGHCYVGSATQKGWRLITVVLHSPDYVSETGALMKYGFSQFMPTMVAKAGETVANCPVTRGVVPAVPAALRSSLQVVTRKGEVPQIAKNLKIFPAFAPLYAGTPVGLMEVSLNGKVVGSSPLLATTGVAASPTAATKKETPLRGGMMVATILAMGLVSLRYGTRVTAFAQSARRRGSRLAKVFRGDDLRR